jgi:hypothetical protein
MALDRTRWGKLGANWHSVAMSIDVLLIECKACNRRSALGKDDGLPIYRGNMSAVSETNIQIPQGRSKRHPADRGRSRHVLGRRPRPRVLMPWSGSCTR